jgi:hypothetical protein
MEIAAVNESHTAANKLGFVVFYYYSISNGSLTFSPFQWIVGGDKFSREVACACFFLNPVNTKGVPACCFQMKKSNLNISACLSHC